jgi:ATP/maltotriose-dependent transcriptional regulator MalT
MKRSWEVRDRETGGVAGSEEILERLRGGSQRAVTLVLRGAAGTGRTSLLDDVSRSAEGWRLVQLTVPPDERDLPRAGIIALLRRLASSVPEVRERADELRRELGLRTPMDRLSAATALLELLEDVTVPEQPVLIAVDDAHHLDDASASCLTFVGRRLQRPGLALLLSVRRGADPRIEQSGLPLFECDRISTETVVELIEQRTGRRTTPAVAETVIEHVEGSPARLLSVVPHLTDEQLLGWTSLPVPLPAGDAPDIVPHEPLSPATSLALAIVALSLTPDTPVITRAMTLLGVPLSALEPAEAAGLIHLDARRCVFRRSLLRSVVAARTRPADRRRLHSHLAEAVAELAPTDLEARTHHLAAATVETHPTLVPLLLELAAQAEDTGDPLGAARACAEAARRSPRAEERGQLSLRAARLARGAGFNGWARLLLDAALRMTGPSATHYEALEVRGYAQFTGGEAIAALHGLISQADDLGEVDPLHASRLYVAAAGAGTLAGDLEHAGRAARRAVDLAPARTAEVALAGTALGVIEVLTGRGGSGSRLLERHLPSLIDLKEDIGATYMRASGLLSRVWLDDVDGARVELRRLVAELTDAGRTGQLPLPLGSLAWAEYRRGWWDAAVEHATLGRELGEASGQLPLAGNAHAVLATVAAARGEVDSCHRHVAIVRRIVSATGAEPLLGHVAAAEGLLQLGLGDPAHAVLRFEEASRVAQRNGVRESAVLACAGDLLLAYAEADRADDAQLLLVRLEEEAERSGHRWVQAMVHRGHALLGAPQHAYGRLVRSSRLLAPLINPFEEARNRLLAAELLLQQGRGEQAAGEARIARVTLSSLAAAPWLRRTERLIALTFEAPTRSGQALSALTPQEQRVVALVAQGASNRDVATSMMLNRKTIEYHLHNVYQKLALTSRTQLVRLVSQQTDASESDEAPDR